MATFAPASPQCPMGRGIQGRITPTYKDGASNFKGYVQPTGRSRPNPPPALE